MDFTAHLLWTQCSGDECGGISLRLFVLRDTGIVDWEWVCNEFINISLYYNIPGFLYRMDIGYSVNLIKTNVIFVSNC